MAIEPTMQHCFNCGEEIGIYVRYPGDEPECCGKKECMRELRYQMQDEEADRRCRAEEDRYERYAY